MLVTLIRTIIFYFFLTVAVRLMGRRQVGELQPGELVITLLMSQIASQPISDTDIPIGYSVIAIIALIGLEIAMSVVSLKSAKFRSLWQGNALVIIRDGVLDQNQMKRLRLSMDDVIEGLRQKDVFDISDVQYAISETDGSMSVLLKPGKRQPSNDDLKLKPPEDALPCLIISDGRILQSNYNDCNMDDNKLNKLLEQSRLTKEEVLLMTADKSGKTVIIKKEGGEQ